MKKVLLGILAVAIIGSISWLRIDESSAPAPLKQIGKWTSDVVLPLARIEKAPEDFSKWALADIEAEMKRLDQDELSAEVFARLNDGSSSESERSKVKAAFHRKNALWVRLMELKVGDMEKQVETLQQTHPRQVEDLRNELGDDA